MAIQAPRARRRPSHRASGRLIDRTRSEQNEGRARGPALRGAAVLDQVRTAATAVERLAPDAACRTAGGPTRGAGEGCGAVVVAGDAEPVARGRRARALVAVGGRVSATGRNRDSADGRAIQRGLNALQLGCSGSGVVTAVVRCVGLHRGLSRAVIDLRLRVAGLVALVEERRNGDRGQQAEDEHDNQKLDEREARLALTALTELREHWFPPGIGLAARAPSLLPVGSQC